MGSWPSLVARKVRATQFGLNKTPVSQQAKINDPSGGATTDAQARTAIAAIIDALEAVGITASS